MAGFQHYGRLSWLRTPRNVLINSLPGMTIFCARNRKRSLRQHLQISFWGIERNWLLFGNSWSGTLRLPNYLEQQPSGATFTRNLWVNQALCRLRWIPFCGMISAIQIYQRSGWLGDM